MTAREDWLEYSDDNGGPLDYRDWCAVKDAREALEKRRAELLEIIATKERQ